MAIIASEYGGDIMETTTNASDRTNAIRIRVRLLSRNVQSQSELKNLELLRSSVLECLSLGCLWRNLVPLIEEDEDVDYRTLGATLIPEIAKSIENVSFFVARAEACEAAGYTINELPELKLTEHELTNLQEWLSTWPTSDRTHRDIAREQIRNGETRPIEEFVADLETAS